MKRFIKRIMCSHILVEDSTFPSYMNNNHSTAVTTHLIESILIHEKIDQADIKVPWRFRI